MELNNNKKQVVEWVVNGLLMLLAIYNHIALIKNWPHLEIGDAQLTEMIGWFYDTVVFIWVFWRNNNITQKAGVSQDVLTALKDGTVSQAQVDDLLKKD